ncbi:cytochrome c oxidase subunit 1 [Phlyctochytrium bullatum]|nr:cytochrome c oxidase subunit 1 [Phlyctochytrium bullatum]
MAALLYKIRSALNINLRTPSTDTTPTQTPRASVDWHLKSRFSHSLAALRSRLSTDSRDSVATVRVNEEAPRASRYSRMVARESTCSTDRELRVDQRTAGVKKLRRAVMMEMFESERTYLRDLRCTIDLYLRGLRRAQIVSKRDLKVLFSNMETLREGHESIQKMILESGADDESELDVPRILIELSKILESYTVYIRNLPRARKRLEALEKDERFKRFLESRAVCLPEHRRLGLAAFLLEPCQRLCKYPVMLKELCKLTQPGHPEFAALRVAAVLVERAVEEAIKPSVWQRLVNAVPVPRRRR